jgi:hypothetical protein
MERVRHHIKGPNGARIPDYVCQASQPMVIACECAEQKVSYHIVGSCNVRTLEKNQNLLPIGSW